MKTVEVVAAVIKSDTAGTNTLGKDAPAVLATQRGYGEFAGGWEFPGGKIEPGETPEQALIREIEEELGAHIALEKFLVTVEYDYPTFHLKMHCFVCRFTQDDYCLHEHLAARWLCEQELDSVDWLPADVTVAHAICKQKVLS